ncbi:MAG TPA: alpha-L-fucosidase, partial [Caldilineaceae bacterium]|nr:alpha-L-fucosidase [Caldilineaceae bacterium]
MTITLQQIDRVAAAGPHQADWATMQNYSVPDWYIDGKFGIFIHWGPYCVPGFGNEWYPRQMYLQDRPEFAHHVATYGPQSTFGYKDFIPLFTAEKFDAEEWATLFQEAGAKFVVPVAEHHDGFQMYASDLCRWNAAEMGPQRDIVGELAASTRAAGMVFGLSSHRAEHWWFMNGGRAFDADVNDPQYADFYGPATPMDGDAHKLDVTPYPDEAYLNDWLLRTCELVDKYQPQLIWFDWWIGHKAFQSYLPRFAAYYYNRGAEWHKGVAVNYKFEAFPKGTAVFDIERGQLAGLPDFFWQNDTSVAKNSWGYTHNQEYKTVASLVTDLVDVVSKNGALLLNIGPKPDGTIPQEEQAMLRAIGRWLAVNGEAIYGTRPWQIFGEGPTEVSEGSFTDTKRAAFTGQDIRFTTKGETLYAILLAWPDQEAVIQALGRDHQRRATINQVTLLGHNDTLTWSHDADALRVRLPAMAPCEHAFVLK